MTTSPAGFNRFVQLAFLLTISLLLYGCGSVRDPDNAPTYGMLGGAGVGTLVGAASGHTGSGAFIGSLFGKAGGSIVRNEKGSPAFYEARWREDIPSVLSEAESFDSRINKDYRRLSAERSKEYGYEREFSKNRAKGVVAEIDRWIVVVRRCESTATEAVAEETSHPTGRIGHWLKIRERAQARGASLETHRSWYKFLAS